ncbi:hypothetical protein BMF94_0768 [Rhodotorula taiwanensis]|uniref:Bestrophin homolog n=1 Tax=Rhodotorula taiwanensis TaxID=741276 RepID=A0A2S5BH12_9BASI|nr:hypothetical protein BMF94_0768 [Rhodotorula taiwanensis]
MRIRPSRVGWWRDVLRIRGSALGRIWHSILGFTLWASLVAVLDLIYARKITLTNNVTPLLSVVVGLLLVFRNNSAYSRWDEGRKQWAKMMSVSRSLTRTIWVNIGLASPTRGPGGPLNLPTEQAPTLSSDTQEGKAQAVRLVVAFLVATKHHIRREYGIKYHDLEALLTPNFVKLASTTGFGWGAAEADLVKKYVDGPATPRGRSSAQHKLRQPRSSTSLLGEAERGRPQTTTTGLRPPLASPSSFKSISGIDGERSPLLTAPPTARSRRLTSLSTESTVILADYMVKPSLPLPLVIAHHLGLYFAKCKSEGLIETIGPAGYNAFVQAVAQLVDCFTACERIANVGVPTVYGIHLKQCTSLFLATLPFVLVESMGFAMIPFVTLVAFTLCGIEGIAVELEMPFGVDDSDLNLDLFCAEIRNEVEHMLARLPSSLCDWDI